jgi:23S rRNA C2498 (ribose-2'-O)-methylase RlmM
MIRDGYIAIYMLARQLSVSVDSLQKLIAYLDLDVVTYEIDKGSKVVSTLSVKVADVDKLKEFMGSKEFLESGLYETVFPSSAVLQARKDVKDYVYIEVVSTLGIPIAYKIGVSKDVPKRQTTLNNGWKNLGVDLTIKMLKISTPVHKACRLESALHNILRYKDKALPFDGFKAVGVEGSTEFFKYDDSVLALAEEVCTENYNENKYRKKEYNGRNN